MRDGVAGGGVEGKVLEIARGGGAEKMQARAVPVGILAVGRHQRVLPGLLAGGEVEGDEFFASVVKKDVGAEVEEALVVHGHGRFPERHSGLGVDGQDAAKREVGDFLFPQEERVAGKVQSGAAGIEEAPPADGAALAHVEALDEAVADDVGAAGADAGGRERERGVGARERPGALHGQLERACGRGQLGAEGLAHFLARVVHGPVGDDVEVLAGDGESEGAFGLERPGAAFERFAGAGVEPHEGVAFAEVNGVRDELGTVEGAPGQTPGPAGFSRGEIEPGEGGDPAQHEDILPDAERLGGADEGIFPGEKAGALVEGDDDSGIAGQADDIAAGDDGGAAEKLRAGAVRAIVVRPLDASVAHVGAEDLPAVRAGVNRAAMDGDGVAVDGAGGAAEIAGKPVVAELGRPAGLAGGGVEADEVQVRAIFGLDFVGGVPLHEKEVAIGPDRVARGHREAQRLLFSIFGTLGSLSPAVVPGVFTQDRPKRIAAGEVKGGQTAGQFGHTPAGEKRAVLDEAAVVAGPVVLGRDGGAVLQVRPHRSGGFGGVVGGDDVARAGHDPVAGHLEIDTEAGRGITRRPRSHRREVQDVLAEGLERRRDDKRHRPEGGLEGGANFRAFGRAPHPRVGLAGLKGGGLREHFGRSAGEGAGGPEAGLRGVPERGIGGVEEHFLKAAPGGLGTPVPERFVGEFQQERLGRPRPREAAGCLEDARLGAGCGVRFAGKLRLLLLAQGYEFGGGFALQVQVERPVGIEQAAAAAPRHALGSGEGVAEEAVHGADAPARGGIGDGAPAFIGIVGCQQAQRAAHGRDGRGSGLGREPPRPGGPGDEGNVGRGDFRGDPFPLGAPLGVGMVGIVVQFEFRDAGLGLG